MKYNLLCERNARAILEAACKLLRKAREVSSFRFRLVRRVPGKVILAAKSNCRYIALQTKRECSMRTYQEWQKINPSKAGLLAACAAAIRQVVPEAEVILYGSVARGEETPESDIDLLVLVPQEVTYELKRKIRDQIFEIELEHDQVIATMIYQGTKWNSEPLNFMPLYRAIVREGVQI